MESQKHNDLISDFKNTYQNINKPKTKQNIQITPFYGMAQKYGNLMSTNDFQEIKLDNQFMDDEMFKPFDDSRRQAMPHYI